MISEQSDRRNVAAPLQRMRAQHNSSWSWVFPSCDTHFVYRRMACTLFQTDQLWGNLSNASTIRWKNAAGPCSEKGLPADATHMSSHTHRGHASNAPFTHQT